MRRLRDLRQRLQGTPGTGIHRAEGTLQPLRGLQPLRHRHCMPERRDRAGAGERGSRDRGGGEAGDMNSIKLTWRSVVVLLAFVLLALISASRVPGQVIQYE